MSQRAHSSIADVATVREAQPGAVTQLGSTDGDETLIRHLLQAAEVQMLECRTTRDQRDHSLVVHCAASSHAEMSQRRASTRHCRQSHRAHFLATVQLQVLQRRAARSQRHDAMRSHQLQRMHTQHAEGGSGCAGEETADQSREGREGGMHEHRCVLLQHGAAHVRFLPD